MGKSKEVKSNSVRIDVVNLILGAIAIASGVLICIFRNTYLQYILIALGLFFVGTGSYNLARRRYAKEIIMIIAGVLLVFLAVYRLKTALIILGVVIILIAILMLAISINRKEKGFKAGLTYGVFILGLLAGAVMIAIAFVAEDWMYILFGASFAAAGLLAFIKSVA
ncbi:MAG TPA: hypothetical protein PKX91_03595 [Clostridia bacterium]|jgi:hypothetical protein|nr:hypothetical protein [Clostridia bacterium]